VTTVVGLAGHSGVWMAADSLTNVYDRPVSGAEKILRLPIAGNRHVLLGFSGNAGMPGIVRRIWDADRCLPDEASELQSWCDEIASQLTEPMVAAGMVEDGMLDGNLLLGVSGRTVGVESTIWTLGHHMAIRHPDDRGAVGSGEGPAIGALDALLSCGVPPHDAVRQACKFAIIRDRWSGYPVNEVWLPATESPATPNGPSASCRRRRSSSRAALGIPCVATRSHDRSQKGLPVRFQVLLGGGSPRVSDLDRRDAGE